MAGNFEIQRILKYIGIHCTWNLNKMTIINTVVILRQLKCILKSVKKNYDSWYNKNIDLEISSLYSTFANKAAEVINSSEFITVPAIYMDRLLSGSRNCKRRVVFDFIMVVEENIS